MANEQDAKVDSSPLGEEIASSPEVQEEIKEQQPDTQTPPAEQGESQEEEQQETENVPFHKHPRFQELIEENKWLKSNMETIIQQRQNQLQFQQPQQDRYAGMTLEEKAFWQNVDNRIEERATKIAEQRIGQLTPMLDMGAKELATIKLQQFRKEHADVKPDSPEEYSIARKMNEARAMGYPMNAEEAYWIVMGNKGLKVAETKVKQQTKKQFEAKKQANVEQRSIPSGNNLPTKEKLTLRQRIEREAANMTF